MGVTERHWESQFDDYTSRILGTLTAASISLLLRREAKHLGFQGDYSWHIHRERGQITVTTSDAVSEEDILALFSTIDTTVMIKAARYHQVQKTYFALMNRWDFPVYKDCNDMRTLCAVIDELEAAKRNPLKAMVVLHGRLADSMEEVAGDEKF